MTTLWVETSRKKDCLFKTSFLTSPKSNRIVFYIASRHTYTDGWLYIGTLNIILTDCIHNYYTYNHIQREFWMLSVWTKENQINCTKPMSSLYPDLQCRHMALYKKQIKYSGHLPLQTTALSLWRFYLHLISNKALYERKHSEPISMMALHAQWNLFGHFLRLLPNVPANKDMTAYFCHPGAGGMADQELHYQQFLTTISRAPHIK